MSGIMPLKVAVFGGSSYGRNCIRYILGSNKAELVGFYEQDEETAESFLSLFDIKRFAVCEALLDIVDAVIIALPIAERYKVAAVALRKGKHILVESPVSYKPSEIEHLISVANEAQVVHTVSIGEILSRAKVEKEPQFIDSKMYISGGGKDGSNIFEILVHDIHLFIKMMNSGIKKVRKNIIGKNIIVRFEFENETAAHYSLMHSDSTFTANTPDSQEIVIYNASDIISIKEKESTQYSSAKKDIEIFFSCIFDNTEYYPFFEKEFVSIDTASKIIQQ
jgi:hypothetical protein